MSFPRKLALDNSTKEHSIHYQWGGGTVPPHVAIELKIKIHIASEFQVSKLYSRAKKLDGDLFFGRQ